MGINDGAQVLRSKSKLEAAISSRPLLDSLVPPRTPSPLRESCAGKPDRADSAGMTQPGKSRLRSSILSVNRRLGPQVKTFVVPATSLKARVWAGRITLGLGHGEVYAHKTLFENLSRTTLGMGRAEPARLCPTTFLICPGREG